MKLSNSELLFLSEIKAKAPRYKPERLLLLLFVVT